MAAPKKPKSDAEKVKEAKERRERFVKYGNIRIGKAVTAIGSLADITNPRSYDFNAADKTTMLKTLRDAVDALETSWNAALAAPKNTGSNKNSVKVFA